MTTTPTPDVAVRTAGTADADGMGAAQAQAWRASLADALPSSVLDQLDADAFAEMWRASLSSPPSPVHRALVATDAGRIVGLAAVAPTEQEGVGELLALSVLPEARHIGHGSRLLNAAADTLRVNDFREMHCWVPLPDAATQQFVRAAGLEPDGAYRDREINDSHTLREVRLVASLEA